MPQLSCAYERPYYTYKEYNLPVIVNTVHCKYLALISLLKQTIKLFDNSVTEQACLIAIHSFTTGNKTSRKKIRSKEDMFERRKVGNQVGRMLVRGR